MFSKSKRKVTQGKLWSEYYMVYILPSNLCGWCMFCWWIFPLLLVFLTIFQFPEIPINVSHMASVFRLLFSTFSYRVLKFQWLCSIVFQTVHGRSQTLRGRNTCYLKNESFLFQTDERYWSRTDVTMFSTDRRLFRAFPAQWVSTKNGSFRNL